MRVGFPGCTAGAARPAGITAALSVALAVAVLLAGCSSGPAEPSTLPTTSPTPTASATPTATTPRAQVEATVRAYYAAVALAASTGDTSDLLRLTSSDCNCRKVARKASEVFRHGGSTDGVSIVVERLKTSAPGGAVFTVQADSVSAAYVIRRSELPPASIPARKSRSLLTVEQRDGRWIVTDVRSLTS